MFKLFFSLMLAAMVAVLVIAVNPNLVFPINGNQLAHSINRQAKTESLNCRESLKQDGRWVCEEDEPGSGVLAFWSARLDDQGCWKARRHESKQRYRGCVTSSDFYASLLG